MTLSDFAAQVNEIRELFSGEPEVFVQMSCGDDVAFRAEVSKVVVCMSLGKVFVLAETSLRVREPAREVQK